MSRALLPPRLVRRAGRPGWHAYLSRRRPHVALHTENEVEALRLLAALVDESKPGESPIRYRNLVTGPVVYFLQAGLGGPVKIGRADNLASRMRALQTAQHERLIVLGVVKDQPDLEKQMHAFFARDRISGEWFRPSAELLKFVSWHTARPR